MFIRNRLHRLLQKITAKHSPCLSAELTMPLQTRSCLISLSFPAAAHSSINRPVFTRQERNNVIIYLNVICCIITPIPYGVTSNGLLWNALFALCSVCFSAPVPKAAADGACTSSSIAGVIPWSLSAWSIIHSVTSQPILTLLVCGMKCNALKWSCHAAIKNVTGKCHVHNWYWWYEDASWQDYERRNLERKPGLASVTIMAWGRGRERK